MIRRFLTFGQYLRDVFGEVVYKVNVDAGFTCPNRDGTLGVSGCIYCNNSAFRPSEVKSAIPIREQIQRGISYLSVRYNANKFLVYFQPYTNTYAPVERLEQLYREALSVPSVIGLTIGTRPDCVEEDKLALLSDIAQNYFILIEYGLQSIYDRSLQFILRGHDYRTFLDAVQRAQRRRIHVGAHIIAGLPTETREETLAMADKLSNINIRFLKIHQLQVVKGTPLAKLYLEKQFSVFGYLEYLDFLVDFIERLSPQIVLQRLFAMAPQDILIAPKWRKNKQELLADIQKRFIQRDAVQGSMFKGLNPGKAIQITPVDESLARGTKK